MTMEQIIAHAKEKLGRDITEQESQDYINGKAEIPDDVLDLVSGGSGCATVPDKCRNCQLVFTCAKFGNDPEKNCPKERKNHI